MAYLVLFSPFCPPEEELFPVAGDALGRGPRDDDGRPRADRAETFATVTAATFAAAAAAVIVYFLMLLPRIVVNTTVVVLRALLLSNNHDTLRCVACGRLAGGQTAKKCLPAYGRNTSSGQMAQARRWV